VGRPVRLFLTNDPKGEGRSVFVVKQVSCLLSATPSASNIDFSP
jgi:hypothetical protein